MEQEAAKRWFKKCIGMLLGTLTLIVLAVIIVDPYFHYHKPFSFLSYRLYEERYINDGMARHFDYDAIITGTSMAQNFKTSEMDALFGTKSIKVPFSGAGYQELSQNLDRALSRNQKLKTVLWAVDYNGLLREYDWQQYVEYPVYLYDENPLNDVSYVFNKSILYHGVLSNLVLSLQGGSSTSLDDYSSWQKETGLFYIMLSYDRENVNIPSNKEFGEAEFETVTQTIEENIVSLANKYPDTEFILFYTPYSICYWDALQIEGTILKQTEAEKLATEMLLQCPNVKLYNFYDQHDVICNTNYYSDGGHYSAEVNSLILNWIAQGTGLITQENYLQKLEEEREFYLNYDYDSIYLELEENQ
ncbi:MAG: hypothetical protein NC429_03105 [Lachnospiraceae bacterium]|nr:hypothetical protein [Lachnospiraceae bacterium]